MCDIFHPETQWYASATAVKVDSLVISVLGYAASPRLWTLAQQAVGSAPVKVGYSVEIADSVGHVHVVEIVDRKVVNFKFSPAHRNYTVTNGRRGFPRVFFEFDVNAWYAKSGDVRRMVDAQNKEHKNQYWKMVGEKYHDLAVAELMVVLGDADLIKLNSNLRSMSVNDRHNWFVAMGYSNIPPVHVFEKMHCIANIPVESGDDGFGHQCGTMITIDHINKTFSDVFGWSSDD